MARNEEKQYCKLNRLILQKQREEEAKKNPKRPHLNSLKNTAEIRHWLPTIKKDIDFYITQLKVWCYPERKITEFNTRIDQLRREHQAFVRRLRQEDPGCQGLPGTVRPYAAPRQDAPPTDDEYNSTTPSGLTEESVPSAPKRKKAKRIALPILESALEQQYSQEAKTEPICPYSCANDMTRSGSYDRVMEHTLTETQLLVKVPNLTSVNVELLNHPLTFRQSVNKRDICSNPSEGIHELVGQDPGFSEQPPPHGTNPLGLDYSDSSSEN